MMTQLSKHQYITNHNISAGFVLRLSNHSGVALNTVFHTFFSLCSSFFYVCLKQAVRLHWCGGGAGGWVGGGGGV